MNERIKKLRKIHLKLTQDEFSQKINISRSNLANVEAKRIKVTDRVINDICTAFDVNEIWLRTGEGEMFVENEDSIIAELATEYHLDDFDKAFITHYLQLDGAGRKTIKEYVAVLSTHLNSVDEIAATVEENNDELDIEAELERYRQELEDEKKAKTLSASIEQKKSG